MDTVSVLVGVVRRPHGLQGEVSVEVRTDEPQRRFQPGTTLDTDPGPLTVRATRWHQGRLLVSFDGVVDRDAAEPLRGRELWLAVPRDEQPAAAEEYYDHQLIGLAAYAEGGTWLGSVSEVLHLPAQDVLVIEGSGRQTMVPFVAALVPDVDLAAGTIRVSASAYDEAAESEEP